MTPRWIVRSTFVLSIAAVAVSGYLTLADLTRPDVLACPTSGAIDCGRVTSSAQSHFLGVPVALLGLCWSIAMLLLCTRAAWASRSRWIAPLRILLVTGGIGFVLWLIYAELFVIRAICLWCTVMHGLVFALFVLVMLSLANDEADVARVERR